MGIKTIKAIKISERLHIDNYKKFNEADICLFDTPGMEKSIEFPKELISSLQEVSDMFAGSISEENIENIAKLGVTFCDLSSSLELDTQIDTKIIKKQKNLLKK